MSKSGILLIFFGTAAAAVIALLLFVGGSTSGTLSTGRSVTTHSNSLSLSSEFRGDTATIKTAGNTIVVRPSELLVNGARVATIDPKVADVEIRVKRGVITFVADGQPVKTAMRK